MDKSSAPNIASVGRATSSPLTWGAAGACGAWGAGAVGVLVLVLAVAEASSAAVAWASVCSAAGMAAASAQRPRPSPITRLRHDSFTHNTKHGTIIGLRKNVAVLNPSPDNTFLDYCVANHDWLLELIEALVAIESPSDDPVAVNRCGAELASRLEAIGGTVTRMPSAAAGDHLRAELRQRVRGRSCCLAISIPSGRSASCNACRSSARAASCSAPACST